ncbi:MAG: DUF4474 domain-containing protein [Firmicutes bacterium]|nr:DUF4474 domain-containing protein [Bacillota bacterium]
MLTILSTFISSLLSLIIMFSNVGAAAEAYNTPMWKGPQKIGLGLTPRFNITFDETLEDMFEGLEEASGFRVQDITSSLPDFYYFYRWLIGIFPDFLYGQRDELIAKGDTLSGFNMAFYRLMGLSLAMPAEVHFFAEEIPTRPGEYKVFMRFIYKDGSTRNLNTNSIYNSATGDFGEKGGVGGLGYNINLRDSYAYTNASNFQRSLGYMKLYDDLLLRTTKMVNVTTVRLKFPYQGKDWMLQLWKGRYFMTTGGEIGLYNKPPSRWIEFYDCATDEERIGMSFRLTAHDGGEDIVLVERDPIDHWWMTGFAIRNQVYTSERLTLETEITPTDAAMKDALAAALAPQMAAGKLYYELLPDDITLLIRW